MAAGVRPIRAFAAPRSSPDAASVRGRHSPSPPAAPSWGAGLVLTGS